MTASKAVGDSTGQIHGPLPRIDLGKAQILHRLVQLHSQDNQNRFLLHVAVSHRDEARSPFVGAPYQPASAEVLCHHLPLLGVRSLLQGHSPSPRVQNQYLAVMT